LVAICFIVSESTKKGGRLASIFRKCFNIKQITVSDMDFVNFLNELPYILAY